MRRGASARLLGAALLLGSSGCNGVLGIHELAASEAGSDGGADAPTDVRGKPEGGTDAACGDVCAPGTTACGDGGVLECKTVGPESCPAWTPKTHCKVHEVCERYGGASCADSRWANWPVPNSAADCEAGAPNPQTYTDNGDMTVTDGVTQLMWQENIDTSTTQADAATYCSNLTLAGHKDWRLPSLPELLSIVDYSRSSPSIDPTYFPKTPASGHFWTSTLVAGSTTKGYDVSFLYGGFDGNNTLSSKLWVRCVR